MSRTWLRSAWKFSWKSPSVLILALWSGQFASDVDTALLLLHVTTLQCHFRLHKEMEVIWNVSGKSSAG